MQLTDLQRLAVFQAAMKVISTETKTGVPYNLRGRVDAELVRDFNENETDRRRITIGGRDVGTLTITMTEPKEVREVGIENYREFIKWLTETEDGVDLLWTFICSREVTPLLKCIEDVLVVDGIVPDGCVVRTHNEPARVKGTVLRGCKPIAIASALGDALPDVMADILILPDKGE